MQHRSGKFARRLRACAPSILVGLAAAQLASPAQAQIAPQVAPDGTRAIEEVVVTARLRREKLQEVPAAISVLSAEQVENAGVKTLGDVAMLVPNMRFSQGYRPGVLQISMRGVATVQGGEPPVAVVVDGVQLPAMEFINQDLLDIQSIEILRGPQGALYGRGAIAGAIVINTRQPGDQFTGKLRASYGNKDSYQVAGDLAGPIVPGKVAAKISVENAASDGFTPDGFLKMNDDSYRRTFVRGDLRFTPNEALEITLGGGASRRQEGANPLSRVANNQISDFSVLPSHNLVSYDQQTLQNVFLKVDYTMRAGTLTSITQFAHSKSYVNGEGDFTANPIATQINDIQLNAFNQDLRFTSDAEGPVRWLVGAFFQQRDGKLFADVRGDPAGANPGARLAIIDNRNKTKASAIYSQASVDLPSNFELSAALRYDRDERSDVDLQIAGSAVQHTFEVLQPQLTLSYKYSEDALAYLTIGKGFRSGGFNTITSARQFNLPRLYPAESLWNYEGGIKTRWLDNHLTLNAAVFYMDFKHSQFFFQQALPPAQYTTTINSAEVIGGELELLYQPTRELTLSAAYGNSSSKILDFNGTSQFVGNRIPNVYDSTLNLGVEYARPIYGDVLGLLRADYQRLGKVYYNQTTDYPFGPQDYVNLRAALSTGRWTAALWTKNLTDQRAPRNFSPQSCGANCSSRINNVPRTYGVEMSVSF